VKISYCILFCFCCATGCFGQDTIAQRNRLSDSVVEHFYVLKSNPKVKVGPYTALLKRKIPIARGNYDNGKKNGVWQFFDIRGRLNEKYNYDKKELTYEAPLYSSGDFSFLFDDSLKRGDRLTRPLKIGGVYYGFVSYLNIFKVPFDTFDMNTDAFEADIELLISPLGQLADYNIRLVSDYYQYDHIFNMDISLFDQEDRTFIPATLNGRPVMSRIIIKCYVGPKGDLDFY
jgi:hypothetical protein